MKIEGLLLFIGLLVFLPEASAQKPIPSGTILPVMLDNSLASNRAHVGETITARLMQAVPAANLKAGAKVIGRVVNVTPASAGAEATITLRFDTVKVRSQSTAIVADLRALASSSEIDEAQIPITGPDRGTPESAWETVQVGGDVVYRGGGPVMENSFLVGKPVLGGVMVSVQPSSEKGCRSSVEGNDDPQALWLFSANACGAYGYGDVNIADAGRTNSPGQITLSSPRGNFTLRGGSGMLLRVISSAASSERT